MSHTLLVASAGGHLTQMAALRRRFSPDVGNVTWVSYGNEHARSLVGAEPFIPAFWPTTRNIGNALRNYRLAHRVFDEETFTRVISTGAGIAVPFLLEAARRRIPACYMESATRTSGPSVSGRILALVPTVKLYTQYEHLATKRWFYRGSIFDSFQASSGAHHTSVAPVGRRILVTLGTHALYPFPRLVHQVRACLVDGDEVTWQLGATEVTGVPGRVTASLSFGEFQRELRHAEVVIGHAGTGTALTTLAAGKIPILVPRRSGLNEHVDDHQVLLATDLGCRRLALPWVSEAAIPRSLVEQAAGTQVREVTPPPIHLED